MMARLTTLAVQDPRVRLARDVPAQNKGCMTFGGVATHFPDGFGPPPPPSLPLILTIKWWETLECTEMSEGTRNGKT